VSGLSSLPTDVPVAPALLFIQHAGVEGYDPILRFGKERIADLSTADGDRFVELLTDKIEEIFTPATAFVPTADRDRCKTCPYAAFCGL
jgi:CRISPR/Cas system-associated exonuclease Cas4 (RecB family)